MLARVACFVLAFLAAPLVPVTVKSIPDLPITYFGILEALCWMALVMLETGAVLLLLFRTFATKEQPGDQSR